jgi:secretion system chaperone SscA
MSSEEHFSEIENQIESWWQQNNTLPHPSLGSKNVDELYEIAYRLYQNQHYQQAIDFFRLLTAIKPFESKYWKGLGAALQMTQEYQLAIESYICAQTVGKGKPDPYLFIYAADCYFALGQIEDGLNALKGAQWSAEEEQETRALQHVALMRQRWSSV